MNIAVLSAGIIQQERTVEMLREYAGRTEAKLKIEYYLSAEKLLKEVETCGGYELYVVDVLMPEMDGIMFAERLRAGGDNGRIIYINGEPSRAWRAFRVRAFDYILSPVRKEYLYESLTEIRNELKLNRISPVVELKVKDGIMRVRLSDITYIDKSSRSCVYHFVDGACERGTTMRSKFSEDVAEYLVHEELTIVGLSLVVNMAHIRSLSRDKLVLSNGEEIHPPKNQFVNINAAWAEYVEKITKE
ncbi:MAG: response regulator [Mogibacterium sp.]|nr:response regulator [Mogibacterium sp.]